MSTRAQTFFLRTTKFAAISGLLFCLQGAFAASPAALTTASSASSPPESILSTSSSAPSATRLDEDQARFFLTRTGFAPNPTELAAYTGLSRAEAVNQLLRNASMSAPVAGPEWTSAPMAPRPRYQDMSVDERKARRELENQHIFSLRSWWLGQMLTTANPLTERMTLFWHNHFVSSQQKVQFAELMYQQNQLLRQHALGNFGVLLHAASKDPAMLIYLDNANNRKGAPNENFAREVMELFALGEGHYSEQDIKEAARAFTGWSIERETGAFVRRAMLHDDESKTVLGQSGRFDGDAVLDILLAQPACGEFIVRKLWGEFISPVADPAEVQRIAQAFRASRYDIQVALRELFSSPAFWAAENRAQLVKSPVELVIGTLKQFNFNYADPLPFSYAVAQLGQNLFNPPNVKGWPGGDAWINSTTLLARKSVLERLFRAIEMGKPVDPSAGGMREGMADGMAAKMARVKGQAALGREGQIRFANAAAKISFDPDAWLGQFGVQADTPPDVRARLAIQHTVLAMAPSSAIRADLSGAAYLRTLLMDPVYQLK